MIRSFFVPGQPQGKGRPRFAKQGNFVKTYTPEKTANYESLIAVMYQQHYAGEPLMQGPLKMVVEADFEIPKSASKKCAALMKTGTFLPTKKPDVDNIAKVICDSLNNVAYGDDTQIVEAHLHKRYGDKPGVTVTIESEEV